MKAAIQYPSIEAFFNEKDFKKTIDEHGSKVIVQAFKDYMNIIKKV